MAGVFLYPYTLYAVKPLFPRIRDISTAPILLNNYKTISKQLSFKIEGGGSLCNVCNRT